MRQMRLKTDMRRADKEIEFFKEKSQFADQISKIEERRERKANK